MNRNLTSTGVLMVISPVLGLVQALKNGVFKNKSYLRGAILIFTVIYGSTFSMEGIGDGERHWQNLYDYYLDLSFNQFWLDVGDIITFRTNDYVNEDLYIHVLSYLLGTVIGLPGLFFTLVAFVYGYFFSGSMVRLFQVFPSVRKHFVVFALAFLFIALLNIQSMNTVRTWTGFWILFYGCISFYQTGKRKYLFMLFLPPLVHIGYFIMAIPVWLVVFFPINKWIIIGLFLASFSFNFVQPTGIFQQLSTWEVGQEKVDAYEVEKKASLDEKVSAYGNKRWYKQYEKSGIVSWCMVAFSIVLILSGIYTGQMNRIEHQMISIGLILKILSNVSWFLYALSNRSDVIFMHFILAGFLLYWQRLRVHGWDVSFKPIYKLTLYLVVVGILPYFVYALSNTIEYASIYLLFLAPISWLDENLRMTIREALGFLI